MKNRFPLLVTALVLSLPNFVVAQTTFTWDGDTDTTFSNGANWANGSAPPNNTATTNTIVFDNSGTVLNQPTLTASQSIGNLQFNTSGWTLGSSPATNLLTLGGGTITSSATSGTNTIAANVLIGSGASAGAMTIGSGGTLYLSSELQINAARTVAVNGGTLRVNRLNTAGGGTNNFGGNGTIQIDNAAGANLTTPVSFGPGTYTVNIGHRSALGSGALTLNSGNFGATTALTGTNAIANNIAYAPGSSVGTTFVGSNSMEFSGNFNYSFTNGRPLSNNMTGGAQLILSGTVDLASAGTNARTQTFRGTGNTLISGNIVSTAGTGGLIKNDSGILTLSGSNSYTGTTTNSAGTLVFAKTQAKAAGTATAVSGAVIGLGVGGAGYYSSADVDSLWANTLSGFTMNAGSGIGIDTTAGDFTYSTSQSTRSLTKLGANTLTLTGSNSYTGATTINSGRLLINGSSASSAVAVNSGGTLGGNGTIGGAVTVNSGGFLAPGNSPGNLTVSNSVTILDGGTVSMEVNGPVVGTEYDRVTMTGAGSVFSLTGTNDLALTRGYTPAVNALFFLLDNQGSSAISGIFEKLNGVTTDLSQGALFTVSGQQFQISYTADVSSGEFLGGNDLALLAVPEPSTWALLACSLMSLMSVMILRRRRRN